MPIFTPTTGGGLTWTVPVMVPAGAMPGRASALRNQFPAVPRIPKPCLQTKVVHVNGLTNDIVNEVWQAARIAPHDLKNFTAQMQGKTPVESMQLIWAFTRDQIKYKLDPKGEQWIKTPARIWHDRFGDCKAYSIFISGYLQNLNIPHALRFVAFKDGGDFTHVYVVAFDSGKAYVLDACLPQFSQEKPYKRKQDIDMTRISILSGIPRKIKRVNSAALHEMRTECAKRHIEAHRSARTFGPTHPRTLALRDEAEFAEDVTGAAANGDLVALRAIEGVYLAGGYSFFRRKAKNKKNIRSLRHKFINTLCQCKRKGIDPRAVRTIAGNTAIAGIAQNFPYDEFVAGVPYDDYMGVGRRRKISLKNITKGVKDVVKKATDTVKDVAKNPVKSAVNVFKKTNPLFVAGRNSYLGLLRLNFRGWAKTFIKAYQPGNEDKLRKLENKWKSLGGNTGDLRKAIEAGSKKKQIGSLNAIGGIHAVAGGAHIGVDPASTSAMLASAGTIIAALAPILALFKKKDEKTPAPEDLPVTADDADVAESAGEAAMTAGGKDEEEDGGETGTGTSGGGKGKGKKRDGFLSKIKGIPWYYQAALGLGIAAGGYYLLKPKRGGRRKR